LVGYRQLLIWILPPLTFSCHCTPTSLRRVTSVTEAGHLIPDSNALTILYNDNEACVKWSYNIIPKAARHIELCDNSVRKWVQDKTLSVKHVTGKVNPADIFTKEMRDGTHFRQLWSFMSQLSSFLMTLSSSFTMLCNSLPIPPPVWRHGSMFAAVPRGILLPYILLRSSKLLRIYLICAVLDVIFFDKLISLSPLTFSETYS
jgi:hypothetical protein